MQPKTGGRERERLEEVLVRSTGLPPEEVVRMLSLGTNALSLDPAYLALVARLSGAMLEFTLPAAYALLNERIPPINQRMTEEYGLTRSPMSADTLGNWLVSFARSPRMLWLLPVLHSTLVPAMITRYLPEIIATLDDMGEGRAEWQKALAILGLLLASEVPA